MLLHAISDEAKRFYENAGFSTSPVDTMTRMITLADVEKAIRDRGDRVSRESARADKRSGWTQTTCSIVVQPSR